MKAAVYLGIDEMAVREVPTPSPGPGEVLLRVKSCAVCGSDVRIFHHGNPRVHPPQTIGHEIAGEVVEIGEGVAKFRVGDRVAVGADVPCGLCHWCQNGMGNNCDVNYAIGYQFPGGFAEYMLLNATTVNYGPVHVVPEVLSFDQAALAEPLACAINGLEQSRMGVGKSLCIIGAGPIGCMMIELGRHMGGTNIIVVQRSARRMEIAKQFGADHYISTEDGDVVGQVRAVTSGEGPDCVVTTCGSVEAHEQGIEMVRHRGYVNLFGGLSRDARPLSVLSNTIHYKECFVHGTHGCVPRHHEAALGLLAAGIVDGSKYITHHFPLDNILDAIAAGENRLGLKVMVNPWLPETQ